MIEESNGLGRILEGDPIEGEKSWENLLRPQTFSEFPGQTEVKEKLKIFVSAAKGRSELRRETLRWSVL